MADRVALNLVPALAQPAESRLRLAEAVELQTRNRQAREAVAAAQEQTDEAEKADVHAAAAPARAGEALGTTTPVAVKKSREQLEMAKRKASAIALALEGAESDLVTSVRQASDDWLSALATAQEEARRSADAALDRFQQSLDDLTKAASASLWLRGALDDGRFDRPTRQATVGTFAPSSERHSANGQAFGASDVIAWARELVEPPAAPPRHLEHATTAQA